MSYAQLQEQVRKYDEKRGWIDQSYQTVLHMQEEVGEISRELLAEQEYKKREFKKEELGQEIADLLYLTIKLANQYKLDLDRVWSDAFVRYEKK
ncbi:MAG TPA: hypothetical protein ENN13_01980 [Candidatus Altiarchaeales archaeon]|nr:hypothetical protein [Candidatus Altiarchaeales archaeon]